MSFLLLLRLIEIQLARTLRLALSRMLSAGKVGAGRHIRRHLALARRSRPLAERMPGLRLELLCRMLLCAAAVTAVRIAAFLERLLELFAAVLPIVTHGYPPG